MTPYTKSPLYLYYDTVTSFRSLFQVMRNIIQACYNTYKPESERLLSDAEATRCLKFSPRLFEVCSTKLFHMLQTNMDTILHILHQNIRSYLMQN